MSPEKLSSIDGGNETNWSIYTDGVGNPEGSNQKKVGIIGDSTWKEFIFFKKPSNPTAIVSAPFSTLDAFATELYTPPPSSAGLL